jgi:hypothetical protein
MRCTDVMRLIERWWVIQWRFYVYEGTRGLAFSKIMGHTDLKIYAGDVA